ncbi:hypothetical protein IWQ57_003257 [Coemansia nantahalensis]|uniref:Uncharacterized protein n=1 Tax=Coemansia nantahalensis TaxID=2789366 RepID=A0ACC1JX76_9FUNG|nr:hypothetical protein IWQ57_003257 [Coemansia nantahalensis]
MHLALIAVAALCLAAVGATAPLEAGDKHVQSGCQTCSITNEDITDQTKLLKAINYDLDVHGLMQVIVEIQGVLGKSATLDMIKGYIIGKTDTKDYNETAPGIHDLLTNVGDCIADAVEKKNYCTTPEADHR